MTALDPDRTAWDFVPPARRDRAPCR